MLSRVIFYYMIFFDSIWLNSKLMFDFHDTIIQIKRRTSERKIILQIKIIKVFEITFSELQQFRFDLFFHHF